MPSDLSGLISHGASPRATLGLVAAIADGITAEHIVNRVISTVLAPRLAPSQDAAISAMEEWAS